MDDQQLNERIAVAANWLDSNRPGWHDEIDLTTLNMSRGECCIGGQLNWPSNTGFNEGWLALRDQITAETGFALEGAFADGKEIWVAEITRRRELVPA